MLSICIVDNRKPQDFFINSNQTVNNILQHYLATKKSIDTVWEVLLITRQWTLGLWPCSIRQLDAPRFLPSADGSIHQWNDILASPYFPASALTFLSLTCKRYCIDFTPSKILACAAYSINTRLLMDSPFDSARSHNNRSEIVKKIRCL